MWGRVVGSEHIWSGCSHLQRRFRRVSRRHIDCWPNKSLQSVLSSSTYSKEIKIIIIIIIITTTCSILVLLYLVYKEWILKVGIWREKLTKGKHACVPGDRRNRQRDKLWWRWTQLGFWCSWWWSLFSELIQKQKQNKKNCLTQERKMDKNVIKKIVIACLHLGIYERERERMCVMVLVLSFSGVLKLFKSKVARALGVV